MVWARSNNPSYWGWPLVASLPAPRAAVGRTREEVANGSLGHPVTLWNDTASYLLIVGTPCNNTPPIWHFRFFIIRTTFSSISMISATFFSTNFGQLDDEVIGCYPIPWRGPPKIADAARKTFLKKFTQIVDFWKSDKLKSFNFSKYKIFS